MAVVINNINVGIGDCLLIISDNKSIIVDCGKFNQNVRSTLADNNIEKLDLVIATHIDNDHISGLCDLLSEVPVGNILFNGFHHIPIEKSTNDPQSISNDVYESLKNYSSYFNINRPLESQVNAKESLSLSEIIKKKNIAWNSIINGERLSVDNKIKFVYNGVKIQLLSPSDDELKKTYYEYRKFINEKMGKLLAKDKLEDLSRSLYDMAKGEQYISSDEYHISAALPLNVKFVEQYANENQGTDTSISNMASLAFVLEIEDKKILMLGDAHPDIVARNLKKIYNGNSVVFDAIKIAHHGSSKNTTTELLSIIDSPIYIFSGGDTNKKPSEYTISKIINREIPTDKFAKRILYFNRNDNKVVGNFERSNNLQRDLSFEVKTNQTQITI